MSAMGPLVKAAVKTGVKYGPHAKAAWDVGGDQVKAAVAKRAAERAALRSAVEKAGSVVDGSVLRTVHAGEKVWLVYSGETPVDCYPVVEAPLEVVAKDVDLDRRRTPEQIEQAKVRRRVQQAGKQGIEKIRRRGADDPLPLPGSDADHGPGAPPAS